MDSGLKNNAEIEDFPQFTLVRPAICRVPFVFNSPHSGRHYSETFIKAAKLDSHALRRSEDFHVDKLFEQVVGLGAPLLKAEFPRAWLDVNREPYELDPAMFKGDLPLNANTSSARVKGGLGTIARIVSENDEIYREQLEVSEGLSRIENHYKPYHKALRGLLAEAVVEFGYGVLIDCHSMPSAGAATSPLIPNRSKPDFVLGDRYATSCAPSITAYAGEFLTDLGYEVAINHPYAGGFITEHYGRPHNGLHALQIEVNRALYMDEKNLQINHHFHQLVADLHTFCGRLMAIPDKDLQPSIPFAAE